MPDLNAIPGMTALRSQTKGDPRIKIAVLDGPIDLDRACFQGANITRLDPYWSEEFPIDPQHLQAFLDVEKSGKSEEEKEYLFKEAIPDENILHSLHLRFHANHIISTICGQPDSPVEGIAPNATVINIPIAYSNEDFINPLNLSRAISTAIEQGVLGVEKVVTDLPSHSEPCMRLSPHTAPSLTVPLLRMQLDFFWLTLYYLG